jgi:anti-sigma28 factor (negative regulator of flagellin synthesis)
MKEAGGPVNPPKSVTDGRQKRTPAAGPREVNDPVRFGKPEDLKEWIASASDIRADRVELIKRKIKLGTYDVKAEEIAEKIIQSEDLSVYLKRSKKLP